MFTSCLGDDDENLTYYDDMAITAFSLGELNRYLYVTASNGADSLVKSKVTGSTYKFYIDQLKGEIYNPDSLPYGTDGAHVICNMTSKNGGNILLKSMTSDSVRYYSSSDSIDFTSPREFRVIANDGSGYRSYMVRVNIHKEKEDVFTWQQMTANSTLGALTGMKAVALGGKLFVFGSDGTTTLTYVSDETDGNTWTQTTYNFNGIPAADAYKSATVYDGYIYMPVGNQLMRTQDGSTWEVAGTADFRQLAGASTTELYALSNSNTLLVSKDGGASWAEDALDDSNAKLPVQDISCTSSPLVTNAKTDRVVLVGSRSLSDYAADSTATVWGNIVEYADGSHDNSWMFYDNTSRQHQLPRLAGLTTFLYDGKIMALGGKGIGGSTAAAFPHFYCSQDGGISWSADARITLPAAFSSSATTFALTVDSRHFIWIVCGESGQIWRGRLSQMGWTTNQTVFTK